MNTSRYIFTYQVPGTAIVRCSTSIRAWRQRLHTRDAGTSVFYYIVSHPSAGSSIDLGVDIHVLQAARCSGCALLRMLCFHPHTTLVCSASVRVSCFVSWVCFCMYVVRVRLHFVQCWQCMCTFNFASYIQYITVPLFCIADANVDDNSERTQAFLVPFVSGKQKVLCICFFGCFFDETNIIVLPFLTKQVYVAFVGTILHSFLPIFLTKHAFRLPLLFFTRKNTILAFLFPSK